jgi:hypothetical protein
MLTARGADTVNTMDARILSLFQREVSRQCRFAMIAARDIDEGLEQRDNEHVFYSVHALLLAATNVSKLLWPSQADTWHLPERGRELRSSLGFGDKDEPAFRMRTFRNHLEHFDSGLEEWAVTSEHKRFADDAIGPRAAIDGIAAGDHVRWLDPETMTFTFTGEDLELRPIVSTLTELDERARIESGRSSSAEFERGDTPGLTPASHPRS